MWSTYPTINLKYDAYNFLVLKSFAAQNISTIVQLWAVAHRFETTGWDKPQQMLKLSVATSLPRRGC